MTAQLWPGTPWCAGSAGHVEPKAEADGKPLAMCPTCGVLRFARRDALGFRLPIHRPPAEALR
jgi:hypothetical protein